MERTCRPLGRIERDVVKGIPNRQSAKDIQFHEAIICRNREGRKIEMTEEIRGKVKPIKMADWAENEVVLAKAKKRKDAPDP